ncbi:MAG: hypothetical protein LBR56_06120 [Sporomusaceae bacterium]|nr:hypothetical protein [Sporomusaceae bacterium]
MPEEMDALEKIEADFVIIEVTDKSTGKTFKRNLPLQYLETDNGVVLSGENLNGEATQINFLSQSALNKITDLIGKGLDKPRCD